MAVGVLCALFAGVFRHVDQHFHTPETFLENTSDLATNADIRERLFAGFRDEIISLADGDAVEDETSGSLADLLDESTADATDPDNERDIAIEEILLDVFDSDLYSQVFTEALTLTQQQIVRTAELEPAALLRDKGDVSFNMRRLYPTLYARLAVDPRTTAITQNEVPEDYGIFKIADRDTTTNFLWTAVRSGPQWRGLMTLAAVASFIGAIVIAERRPSTAIQFGGGIVGVGVVSIVIVYLIRFIVPLLASGGYSASSVVATYVANTAPLVSLMIRLVIMGVVLAALGGIARVIWPDDWVYSSVSDDRGVRSIRRRRGTTEPEPTPQQQPAAAAAPVQYPGYAQPPYPGYPQQWGQPYPGQQYPPGYGTYPVGPYAQTPQPLPQHYTGPGNPTVPVMPVNPQAGPGELVPPAAPPLDAVPGDLPADAAQVVPRVVATTNPTPDTDAGSATTSAPEVVANPESPTSGSANAVDAAAVSDAGAATFAEAATGADTVNEPAKDATEGADEWATENDW